MKYTPDIIYQGALFTFLCISLFLAGCGSPPPVPQLDYRVPVEAITVETGTVENVVRATGNLRARESIAVRSEIPGRLYLERDANGDRLTEGTFVNDGDVIGRILGEEARLHIGAESARVNFENSKNELERKSELWEQGAIPEAEYLTAEANYETAKLNYERTILNEKNVEIITPRSGVLLILARDEKNIPLADGQLIGSGFLVAQVAPLDTLEAYVDLLGSDLIDIEIGQKVRVRYYGNQDLNVSGKLTRISPTVDEQTRTFQAVIEVPNEDGMLRPGMFIEVEIITEQRIDVPVVKHESVATRDNSKVVFLIDGQMVKMQEVQLGLADDEKREVIEGIKPGDRIAIGSLGSLYNNTRVKVINDS